MINIPEIRFPEFRNDGEWEIKDLEFFLDYLQPTGFLVSDTNYNDKYKIPVLTAGKTFILGYTNETEGIFQNNLPVIIFDDFTTASKFVDFPFKAKSSAMKILIAKQDAHIKFVFESMQMIKYEVGVHQRHWISIFSKLKISAPKPSEQQKIADCLTSLDEVITGYEEKLKALQNHKKGLMQNLFPQEGEAVPKYRFPEFKNDGDWVEKELFEVANYENGKAHEKDIDPDGDFIVVNSKFISTEGKTAKYSNTAFCLANSGDILMVLSDVPNGRAIAKCFFVNEENRYTVNQRVCKVSPFDCDNLFLYYIMNRNPYFLSFDDGVKQTNLRNDDVQGFPFLMPKNPNEQKRISDCLSIVDELLKEQANRIAHLKLHKKGLMQGLFPRIKD